MNSPEEVWVFAPATIGNVGCGFDVLGLALDGPGDVVVARRASRSGVRLSRVSGDGGRLPAATGSNTAGVAARALLDLAGEDDRGIEIELEKGLPVSSGLGSSAASAVAAAVAVDALLDLNLPRRKLLAAAMEGERAACGAPIPDNAAPCLYGGLVLIRPAVGGEGIDVVPLRVPSELAVAVVHPRLELATREAREILPESIPLAEAVLQWGNLAAFVAALVTEDWELMSRALVDVVAEPRRAPLVPGFPAVKQAALAAGALGASLSGSGPSVFALCRGLDVAEAAGRAMAAAFEAEAGCATQAFISTAATAGARQLSPS